MDKSFEDKLMFFDFVILHRFLSRIYFVSLMILAGMSLESHAAETIPPADSTDSIQASLDRGAPGGDVMIWNKRLLSAHSSDYRIYGRNALTCTSSTDDTFGRCVTTVRWAEGDSFGLTSVPLRFTESNSRATVVLQVEAAKMPYWQDPPRWSIDKIFKLGFASAIDWDMSMPSWEGTNTGTGVYAKISTDQLKKIPSGGTWTATLKLNEYTWDPTILVAVHTANIALNVTDKNNIQIYFPEFTSAAPQVDLKLKLSLGTGRVSGVSNIDMCLYDGYNSQSTWFDVTASDDLTVTGRNSGSYSVLRDGDPSGEFSKRVDYNVSLAYDGKKVPLPNNQKVRLTGVNSSSGRSVSLPGIPVPVICAPTPLTLETPEFQAVWKQPGKYSGKLRIAFSPSAENL